MESGIREVADGPGSSQLTLLIKLDLLRLLFLLWSAVNQRFCAWQQDVDLCDASREQAVARSIYLQASEFHFSLANRGEVESSRKQTAWPERVSKFDLYKFI